MMEIVAGQALSHAPHPMQLVLAVVILIPPSFASNASTVPKGQRWQYRRGLEATQNPIARMRLAPKYQISSRFRINEMVWDGRCLAG